MKKIILLSSILLSININAQQSPCSDLFFSEYVEGYGQNKAIEIYNPTSAAIDLSNYKIERYSNGATNSSTGGVTILTGMLASGDVFVLTSGETDTTSTFGYIDSVLFDMRDYAEPVGSYPTPMHMNGNDAIVLTRISDNQIVDIFGKVGEDPGICWTDNEASGCVSGFSAPFNPGTWYTTGHTLIRKKTVFNGIYNNPNMFNPSLEWDTLPVGTWNNLGSHVCDDCSVLSSLINQNKEISYSVYPNPVRFGTNITINSSEPINEIKVTDLMGQEIIFFDRQIATYELSRGTYIVTIYFANDQIAKNKLIVY